jgi:hypothetical protein
VATAALAAVVATVTVVAFAALAVVVVASTTVTVVTVVATATALVVAVVAALLLGRAEGVLLIRGDLRLIQPLKPGTLDGADLHPHLSGQHLGVIRIIERRQGRGESQ